MITTIVMSFIYVAGGTGWGFYRNKTMCVDGASRWLDELFLLTSMGCAALRARGHPLEAQCALHAFQPRRVG